MKTIFLHEGDFIPLLKRSKMQLVAAGSGRIMSYDDEEEHHFHLFCTVHDGCKT